MNLILRIQMAYKIYESVKIILLDVPINPHFGGVLEIRLTIHEAPLLRYTSFKTCKVYKV